MDDITNLEGGLPSKVVTFKRYGILLPTKTLMTWFCYDNFGNIKKPGEALALFPELEGANEWRDAALSELEETELVSLRLQIENSNIVEVLVVVKY